MFGIVTYYEVAFQPDPGATGTLALRPESGRGSVTARDGSSVHITKNAVAAYTAEGERAAQVCIQRGQFGITAVTDAGRLTAVILPQIDHPDSQAAGHPRYEYEYDAYGNQTLIRDNVFQLASTGQVLYNHDGQEGDDDRETRFYYDHLNRLAELLPDHPGAAGRAVA